MKNKQDAIGLGKTLYLRVGYLLALPVALGFSQAYAETTDCNEIPSLPYTISSQGIWCAKKDLATAQTSGAAVTVAVNNVTIDFNGFKLGGLGAGPSSTASGVLAVDKKNISILNANIRGFEYGIDFANVQGVLIADSNLDGNLVRTINITGGSTGVIIRDNTIVNYGNNSADYGMFIEASFAKVSNNLIANPNSLNPFGIYTRGGSDILIEGNTIAGGDYIGMRNFNSERVVFRDNLITGGNFSFGGIANGTTSICIGNTVLNASDAFLNCTLVRDNYGVDTPAPDGNVAGGWGAGLDPAVFD